MKKLVEEVDNEGLESLLGEYIVVWCANYNYSGKLIGVNEHDILLDDACFVYETGPHNATEFTTAEQLPGQHYVRTSFIESYGKRQW